MRNLNLSLFLRSIRRSHFGFEKVSEDEKMYRVNQVFNNVAQKYDIMNDVMSIGIHRLWKNYFVNQIAKHSSASASVVDVAAGTGDISLRLAEQFSNIIACDINANMLEYNRLNRGKTKLNYVQADAENMPFSNDQFDVYTIAFGIRNCVHIDRVLKEAFRLLKPNGIFACLEFSEVQHICLRKVYDLYSMNFIPVLGELISDDYKSYKYLVESIRQFPNQKHFAQLITNQGFKNVRYENLSFGIASIHWAVK